MLRTLAVATAVAFLIALSAADARAETVVLAGQDDNFGGGTDPTSPSDVLESLLTPNLQDFDATGFNLRTAHTFANLPGNIVSATVEGRVRALLPIEYLQAFNDNIEFAFSVEGSSDINDAVVYTRFFGPKGVDPGLVVQDHEWAIPDEGDFALELGDLTTRFGDKLNLIPEVNRHGFLDVVVHDDTNADFYRLTFTTATVEKSLLSGPWRETGAGELVHFDVDGLGRVDEGLLIGVGLGFAQHYAYAIVISHDGADDTALDDVAFLDALPQGFELDPEGEAFADSGDILGACDDGSCEGIKVEAACPVTISGTGDKGVPDPRYLSVEPDALAPDTVCSTTVFVATAESSASGKGKHGTVFKPVDCLEAASGGGDALVNTVSLNDGVKVFDKATSILLFGPVGSLQLEPANCE
jgi:hypothetical protein